MSVRNTGNSMIDIVAISGGLMLALPFVLLLVTPFLGGPVISRADRARHSFWGNRRLLLP